MTLKITYSTMSADNAELNEAYEASVAKVRGELGMTHGSVIDGEERTDRPLYTEVSPVDNDIVIGHYAQATTDDVDDAIAVAKAYQPEWEVMGWEARRDIMLAAADVMEERQFDLAALMSFEIGKNRLEGLGDAAETVEFYRYYARQITENNGFVRELSSLGENETNTSVLRPWGVWGVVSPFNFPLALAAGPSIGALLTGNTVVLKPSNAGALMGVEFYKIMRDAGLPSEALQLVLGAGSVAGDYMAHHEDLDGLTFTGSYEVGMHLYRTVNEKRPKPVNAEMGGKNTAIVMSSADLDTAVSGVVRGAFGLSGQKCSATSRVYVQSDVYDEFVDRLVDQTAELTVGDPTELSTFLGPVIDGGAVNRFESAVAEVNDAGGKVLAGGSRLTEGDLTKGHYVEPTVVTAPDDSWVWNKELFLPFVAVTSVESLDEAIEKSNDSEYGLTAGLFSTDRDEINEWFDRIEAGVTYVNRAAGATTGAWPDIQSFGGWKGSGTSGSGGGGPWYLRGFLREQSRTLIL